MESDHPGTYVQQTSSPEPFLVIQTVSLRIIIMVMRQDGDESGDSEDVLISTSVIITYTPNFDKRHNCPVKFVNHLFIHNIRISKSVVIQFSLKKKLPRNSFILTYPFETKQFALLLPQFQVLHQKVQAATGPNQPVYQPKKKTSIILIFIESYPK